MRLPKLFSEPHYTSETDRKNFSAVQLDAIGVGLASAAAPFLPVFLTRLGATNVEVGLLTSMPAFTGLLLAIFLGRYLQSRRNVVPWFAVSRMLTIFGYGLTGLAAFFIPGHYLIYTVLAIWAVITLPQTIVSVLFNVVMASVAGPERRFDLMSRRWSILGFSTAVTVVIAGQVLDMIRFPLNYQVVFIVLSLGGLISYYYSSRIDLSAVAPEPAPPPASLREGLRDDLAQVLSEKPFVSFLVKRFVFLTGVALSAPLFPLYYVRVVNAPDVWIGFFNTAKTAILIVGYFFWIHQSRRRGSRYALLWTTFGLALYPALVGFSTNLAVIALITGLSGIFQAGLDLTFFDELMKTIPPHSSAVFNSFAQGLQYFSTVVAPLVGTLLANWIGLSGALLVSAAFCLAGFAMFWFQKEAPAAY